MIKKVCVYCASSELSDNIYLNSAFKLGALLAENSIDIVYGGGAAGSMGSLARGALSQNGKVYGIIPKFMYDLEWGFEEITELKIVDGMPERKRMLIDGVDAVIVLPGGSGTFEEVFETLTLKRLGMFTNPIIFVNTNNYFSPFKELMEKSISEKFMDERHSDMWTIVDKTTDVIDAIDNSPKWSPDSVNFATLK